MAIAGHDTYTGAVTTTVQQEPSDPRDFFRLLLRRKWILLACVVLIPVAVYVASTRLPKTYEASSVIELQTASVDPSLSGVGDLSGGGGAATNDRVAALIETNGVADQAARVLGEPAGSLRGDATATSNEDTGFITITAEGSTAERAARVANAFAEAVRVTRENQGTERVEAAVANVRRQLREARDEGARLGLRQQLDALEVVRRAQAQNAQVIERATPPASPTSPRPRRNAIFAFIVALLLGAGLVALIDRLDRRLHDPDDIEELTGSAALVHLPPTIFPGSEADPGVPLAFQMLRDSLTYFNVDRDMDSLMVVSAMKGEGKTTVTLNLAMAYARAGKRVVLVDADLRGSVLETRITLAPSAGLTGVLAGDHHVSTVLQEVDPYGENLRVLPAGPTPPNPSELLGSARMAAVMSELKADSDLVIVDTAPLLVVSDAFSLLGRVSGALGVVRLEQTTKDAVRRLNEIVATAETRMYGIVVTGGAPTSGHGYGYGYGYGREYAAPVNGKGRAPGLTSNRPS